MANAAADQIHTSFTVTIRTPAGTPGEFDVKSQERVDKVVRIAVDSFVAKCQLADGEYGLVEVVNGAPTPMTDSNRLEDYGITAKSDLRLVNKAPHVDG